MKKFSASWLIAFAYVLLMGPNIAAETQENTIEEFISKYRLSEDILEIPVVHATRIFPENGIMLPGKAAAKDYDMNGLSIRKGDKLAGPLGWRPTLHWAIGKLASDIVENTLSDRPYAVVVALKYLLPQLVGLQQEDTYILGDFVIPHGAFFVMKEGSLGEIEESKRTWLENMQVMITLPGHGIAKRVDEVINTNFATYLPLLGKKRQSKQQLHQKLKGLSSKIPGVHFGQHSTHPTHIIEELIRYLCKDSYGNYPTEFMQNIFIESEKIYKELVRFYIGILLARDKNLSQLFIKEIGKLKTLIDVLPTQGRTSLQLYQDSINKNNIDEDDPKFRKEHIQHFSQYFIKVKYLADAEFQLNPQPVKIGPLTFASRVRVMQNIKEWFPGS